MFSLLLFELLQNDGFTVGMLINGNATFWLINGGGTFGCGACRLIPMLCCCSGCCCEFDDIVLPLFIELFANFWFDWPETFDWIGCVSTPGGNKGGIWLIFVCCSMSACFWLSSNVIFCVACNTKAWCCCL